MWYTLPSDSTALFRTEDFHMNMGKELVFLLTLLIAMIFSREHDSLYHAIVDLCILHYDR